MPKINRHSVTIHNPVQDEIRLITEYGLTIEAYNVLDQAQNFKCKLCGKPKDLNKFGRLVVDHDHKTGRIRGLLCSQCNAGLGMFKDDAVTLLKAIQYVKGKL